MFTRQKVKDLLPVLQAYVEGKDIQVNYGNHDWLDVPDGKVSFADPVAEYRVKPETKKMVTLVFEWDLAVNTVSVTVDEDIKARTIAYQNNAGRTLIK